MSLTITITRRLACSSKRKGISHYFPSLTPYQSIVPFTSDRRSKQPLPYPVRPFSTGHGNSEGEKRPLPTITEGPGPVGGPGLATGVLKVSEVAPESVKKAEDWNDILNRWYQQYQDFVGITDLKKAQDRVTELSDSLQAAQGERRRLQAELEDLQSRLVDNHNRITKTEQYSKEHMRLFSEARELNEKQRLVRGTFLQYEQMERDNFTHLSAAIRDCHERERMQAEQSKYWSIIASVVSAALASVITSVNNWVRIKEIKEHITTSHHTLLDGYQQMHTDILTSLEPIGRQGDITTPSNDARDIAKEFSDISKLVTETINKATDELVKNINSALVASTRRGEDASVESPVVGNVVIGGGGGGGGDVSYPKVAATMLVGAALGTLVTAFFLGALGGG